MTLHLFLYSSGLFSLTYSLLFLFLLINILSVNLPLIPLSRSPLLPSLPQNELPDTHAKFHVLFLFFVAAMFCISILSLFSYHLWLVGKNRSTIGNTHTHTFKRCLLFNLHTTHYSMCISLYQHRNAEITFSISHTSVHLSSLSSLAGCRLFIFCVIVCLICVFVLLPPLSRGLQSTGF